MSIEYIRVAFSADLKNPIQKLVLLKLAENADRNGKCFPSIAYIARLCNCSKSSVKNHIRALKKKNLISIKNRCSKYGGYSSNLYFLDIEAISKISIDGISVNLDKVTAAPEVYQLLPEGGADDVHIKVNEPSIKKSHNFHEEVSEIWNNCLAESGKEKFHGWTPRRVKDFDNRCKVSKRASIGWWKELILDIQNHPLALSSSWFTLSWLITSEENLLNFLEGKYRQINTDFSQKPISAFSNDELLVLAAERKVSTIGKSKNELLSALQ